MNKLYYQNIFCPLLYSSTETRRTSETLFRLVPFGAAHALNHCKKLNLLHKSSFIPQPWPWWSSDNINVIKLISAANLLNTETPLRRGQSNEDGRFFFAILGGRKWKQLSLFCYKINNNLLVFLIYISLMHENTDRLMSYDFRSFLRVISSFIYKHLIATVIVLINHWKNSTALPIQYNILLMLTQFSNKILSCS